MQQPTKPFCNNLHFYFATFCKKGLQKTDIFPEITLQEGHIYHIVDSDPATWSTNSGADEMGFVELFTDAETDVEGIFTPCYGN